MEEQTISLGKRIRFLKEIRGARFLPSDLWEIDSPFGNIGSSRWIIRNLRTRKVSLFDLSTMIQDGIIELLPPIKPSGINEYKTLRGLQD